MIQGFNFVYVYIVSVYKINFIKVAVYTSIVFIQVAKTDLPEKHEYTRGKTV